MEHIKSIKSEIFNLRIDRHELKKVLKIAIPEGTPDKQFVKEQKGDFPIVGYLADGSCRCKICDKTFATESRLNTHMRTITHKNVFIKYQRDIKNINLPEMNDRIRYLKNLREAIKNKANM